MERAAYLESMHASSSALLFTPGLYGGVLSTDISIDWASEQLLSSSMLSGFGGLYGGDDGVSSLDDIMAPIRQRSCCC